MKFGYKDTEACLVPEEWEVRELRELVTFLDGKRRPVRSSDRAKIRGSIPYYGASGIVDYVNDYIFDDELILLGEDGENILSRNLPLAFRISGKAWVNNHAHVLKPNPDISIGFLTEYLESLNYETLNSGTAQPKLNKKKCSSILVAVPPQVEQRAIAEALSDVDALLGALDRLIAKKLDLKQAAMQQLLTGQTRLPGFQGMWEEKRLGDLGVTYGGLTGKTKADFGAGEARYITFMNVMANVIINCATFARVTVRPTESQNVARKGDLFFNGSSETPEEVAMCSVLLEEVQGVYLNSFCFGFRFREGADADGLFLAYYMRGPKGRELMKSLAQGSTRYNLSKVALLNLALRLPMPSEQAAIAGALREMDLELAGLERRREKTLALKQGMMQELLTGRTRLVTPESAHA